MLAHPSQAGNRVGAGTHLELASGAELASAQASAMSHGAAWRTLAGRSKAPKVRGRLWGFTVDHETLYRRLPLCPIILIKPIWGYYVKILLRRGI